MSVYLACCGVFACIDATCGGDFGVVILFSGRVGCKYNKMANGKCEGTKKLRIVCPCVQMTGCKCLIPETSALDATRGLHGPTQVT
mmetsp:Transcript_69733/g.117123  ORF Transcript_69733/g.117123 Transcript_69733/m.117123 type:complete len:86 (+) Transcript_69733:285-542(+)